MSRWFRVYAELIDDPKFIKLGPDLRSALLTMWCVAAANEGILPALEDIAIKFRLSEQRTKKLIDELDRSGFVDRDHNGMLRPHNWDGRQYKSDVTDPTNNERQKRYREKKRNGVTTVTDKRPDTEAETEQIDIRLDTRASPLVFTEGSKRLADALWRALGIEAPLGVPPELAGTDWRAIEWDRAGWTEEIVASAARRVGPGKPLSYYEKAIASEFAKLNAPLPTVEIKPAEHLTVYHGTPQTNSVSAVAKRWAEQFESQSGDDIEGNPGAVLRLPTR